MVDHPAMPMAKCLGTPFKRSPAPHYEEECGDGGGGMGRGGCEIVLLYQCTHIVN